MVVVSDVSLLLPSVVWLRSSLVLVVVLPVLVAVVLAAFVSVSSPILCCSVVAPACPISFLVPSAVPVLVPVSSLVEVFLLSSVRVPVSVPLFWAVVLPVFADWVLSVLVSVVL